MMKFQDLLVKWTKLGTTKPVILYKIGLNICGSY